MSRSHVQNKENGFVWSWDTCISHCEDKLYVCELLFGVCIVASCIALFSMHGYNYYNVSCNSLKSLTIYKYATTGLLPLQFSFCEAIWPSSCISKLRLLQHRGIESHSMLCTHVVMSIALSIQPNCQSFSSIPPP